MKSVLREAIHQFRVDIGEAIHLVPREFMAVRMKSGEPCPRCGAPISLVGANQRITNFCRASGSSSRSLARQCLNTTAVVRVKGAFTSYLPTLSL